MLGYCLGQRAAAVLPASVENALQAKATGFPNLAWLTGMPAQLV